MISNNSSKPSWSKTKRSILLITITLGNLLVATPFLFRTHKVTLYRTKNHISLSSKKDDYMNPIESIVDMFKNFDDAMDDFFNNRMGAGEQWYGKRKYNPSGKFERDYEGLGLTDSRKIEIAREYKDEKMKKQQRSVKK